MCEIYGMSETDLGWEGSIEKKESSIAKLNGRKYKVTILHEETTLAGVIYKHGAHGCSLQNRSVTNSQITPVKVGGSVEVEFKIQFGDEDGPKYRGSASVEAHDEKGNYAKVEADRDSSGKSNVAVAAGYKKDEN